MSCCQRFSVKDPGGKIILAFDFSAGLASTETLTGSPTVVIKVDYGTDPLVSLSQNGAAAFDTTNTIVYVPVQGGLDQCDYDIVVSCQTSNAEKLLVLSSILPVRAQ